MGLKFRCTNCNEYIYLQFLKVGDIAECKNCSQKNIVPEDVETTTNGDKSTNQQATNTKSDQSTITPQNAKSVPEVERNATAKSSQVNKLNVIRNVVVVNGKEYVLASRRRRYLAVMLNELFILLYAGVYVCQAFLETIFRRKVNSVIASLTGLALIIVAVILDQTGTITLSDNGINELLVFIFIISWLFGGVGIFSIVILLLVLSTNFFPSFFITLFLFGTFFGGDGALKGKGWTKKACRIRVIHSQTGKPCTFWQAFIRRLLIYIPLIGFVDSLWALGHRKQRLGDILAKTIVIKQERDDIVVGDRPADKTVKFFLLLFILFYSSNLIFRLIFPTSIFDSNHLIDEVKSSKIIKSTDGQFQVTVPSNWNVIPELHDDASLEVGSKWDDIYLIVLVDKKDELVDTNLENYSQITRGTILSELETDVTSEFIEISGPVELRVYDNKALQYQINGVIKGFDIVYLHTSAENVQYYYQIIFFGSPSNFSNGKIEILQEVIQSIRNVP